MVESGYAVGARHERKASVNTTTGQLELPAVEFALSDLFEQVPDARVELEPAVATPDDHALVVVQATEREGRTVESALRVDPALETVERFSERADKWTYRVTWDRSARRFVRCIVAEDVTLLSARAQNGRWRFRLVSADRDAFANAYDAIEDLGCTPDCRSITSFEGECASRSKLTDDQQEALVAAFEAGHYNIPRDATANEVADILGISHQALSERLRRGMKALLKDTRGTHGETKG